MHADFRREKFGYSSALICVSSICVDQRVNAFFPADKRGFKCTQIYAEKDVGVLSASICVSFNLRISAGKCISSADKRGFKCTQMYAEKDVGVYQR
jgi:hypothetical protein